MKLFITFIRHGTTKPNTEGRWAGSVDIPITEKAKKDLAELANKYTYPVVERIYRSPMMRCKQTQDQIYPNRESSILPGVREVDFGEYEGRYAPDTYKEPGADGIRDKRLDYRFTGGESFEECLNRGIQAIDTIVEENCDSDISQIAVFTHAMWTSVMMTYCLNPPKTPEELFCGNGMGISVWLEPEEWKSSRVMHFQEVIPVGAPRPRTEDSPYHAPKKEKIQIA